MMQERSVHNLALSSRGRDYADLYPLFSSVSLHLQADTCAAGTVSKSSLIDKKTIADIAEFAQRSHTD